MSFPTALQSPPVKSPTNGSRAFGFPVNGSGYDGGNHTKSHEGKLGLGTSRCQILAKPHHACRDVCILLSVNVPAVVLYEATCEGFADGRPQVSSALPD